MVHEEIDAVPARATIMIFNNLVMFDQHVKQNSIKSVVPDLATGWSWNEDGTELTFPLRQGVSGTTAKCSLGPRPDIPRYAFSLRAAGGVVTRRGAIGAAGMLLTSISGIGRSRKPRTALASSL